jgi:hypothetical protein
MKRFAYTDESGNSGLKLFDSGQDIFWTGTLISHEDLDLHCQSIHKELLVLAGIAELHGADLGFGGIEKIAGRLCTLIGEKDLLFVFGRVDKKFLAGAKLFDLAFDSGTNPAMPTHVYGVQQLRLMAMMHFVQILSEEDERQFWDLFAKQDASRFGTLLARLATRVPKFPYDSRTKQVLVDVLTWGAANPSAILDPFGKAHSPNFVAFCTLFGQLHDLHRETGDIVGSFVHDEQNQFVPTFVKGWDLLSKFEGRNHPTAMITDWKKIESFDCELVERSSAESFGLQLLDICMWLLRRVLDNKDVPRGACARLFRLLLERGNISVFDFNNLVQRMKSGARYVEDLSLTPAELERGKSFMAELEATRKRRLLHPSGS